MEMMKKASARQEIGSAFPELAGGTTAKNKAKALRPVIVENLNGIENRGHKLGFINEHGLPGARFNESFAFPSKEARLGQHATALFRVGEIIAQIRSKELP